MAHSTATDSRHQEEKNLLNANGLPSPTGNQNGNRTNRGIWKWLLGPSWDTAILLSIIVLVATGLLRGGLHSTHLPYRQQTEVFLQGKLALGHDVRALFWDLAWDNGAIQQVWGLGVPAWRTPFEALAKLCGFAAFPDRLAFGIALALVILVCLKFHWKALARMSPSFPESSVAITSLPLVGSPVLLTLCLSKFEAYEEAVAYGFLASLLLMAWTAHLFVKPRLGGFAALCLFAGFLPFIRPTLVFYGLSSVLVGALALCRLGRSFKVLLVGGACFSIGIGLLLWSNDVRFGSPLEFGHRLNLNTISAMRYASRFDQPFRTESVPSAARELFSATFLKRTPPGNSWPWAYHEQIFVGQSPVFRWREVYLSSFDLTWLAMLVGSWTCLGRKWWRQHQRREKLTLGVMEVVCLWSVLPMLLLSVFYLRCPFISSRYLLDFGAALTATVWCGAVLLARFAQTNRSRGWWLRYVPVAFVIWWGWEVVTIKVIGWIPPTTRQEIAAQIQSKGGPADELLFPVDYQSATEAQDVGIPFNGTGWGLSGVTESSVAIFVQDPECLILDVALANSETGSLAAFENIRAKIGLEILERVSMTPTADGMRVVFRGAHHERYQRGVQVVFLAMVPMEQLSTSDSPLRLLRVAWKGDTRKAGSDKEGNQVQKD